MKFLLSILISLMAMSLSAQIQLKAFFEQDTLMIGDTVGLNYQILVMPGTEITAMDLSPLDSVFTMEQMQTALSDTSINWEKVFNSKSQFEILNYGRWTPTEADALIPATGLRWKETVSAQGGQKILSNRLTAVFWDEGHFIIPNPKIAFRRANQVRIFGQAGAGNQVYVEVPTIVDVSEIDTLTQLTPIKPILEEDLNWKDFLWVYIALAVLLFGALLYRYLTKEEELIEEVEAEIILPPHVIAFQKLEDLKKAELWQKGDVKEYQTRLTYTLREYLENRYDMQALESTTAQISEELRKSDVAEDWRNKLRDLLQVADLVKFAKAEPEEEFHARVLSEAVEFVEETKKEVIEEEVELVITPVKKEVLGSLWIRIWAEIINYLVTAFILVSGFLLAALSLDFVKEGLLITIPFALLAIYHQVILVNQNNKSAGKFLLKIAVRNEDNSIPSFWNALVRSFAKTGAFVLIFSFIRSIMSKDNRLGHDLKTNTKVIDLRKKSKKDA